MYLFKKRLNKKVGIGSAKVCLNKKKKIKACEEDLKSLGPEEE